MADVYSTTKRSEVMRAVKSKNTRPELLIRKALHSLGYRFRLHAADLPGKPDIVLPKYKTVIQVRGCFWHGHGCKYSQRPRTRKDFWDKKLSNNSKRDHRNDRLLRDEGWSVLVVWTCKCNSRQNLEREVNRLDRKLQERLGAYKT